MSKHEEYWQKRAEERLVDSEQIALRAEKVMEKAFKAAAKDIELQIYKLYGKYAQDNQLSYAETLAYLTNDELAEFQQDLHFYIAKMQDREYRTAYKAYLQALSTRARVKRLEAYQAQLQMIADGLYYGQVIPVATEAAVAIVQDSYLKSAFDLSQGIGLLLSFQQPSAKIVDTILEYPWSGKNFSQKWTDNCANFEAVLNETLTKGLITGASNQRMAEELAIKTNNAYNNAIRLVRTETNYIHNAASAAFSEEIGIEKYQFVATLDLLTSTICRSLDGEIFSYADKMIGVNYPPIHPWCRSTKVDVIDEEWLKQGTRVARDKDGKTIKVPREMTYQDWYEKYVKSDPEYLKQERMLKNRHADKKQYEKYKAAFGDTKMLKSLDEFLEMKYNKPRAWQALKEQYKEISSLYKEYHYNPDGTLRITDDWKGLHQSLPREYKPFAVIETIGIRGDFKQIDRTIYDENGLMRMQIHSGPHANPKRHPYGKYGEHKHLYNRDDENKVQRTTEELNDEERIMHKDILKDEGK